MAALYYEGLQPQFSNLILQLNFTVNFKTLIQFCTLQLFLQTCNSRFG